jgi:copper(I)-binding protein
MRSLRSLPAAALLAVVFGAPALAADEQPVAPPRGLAAGVSSKGPHHVYLVGDLLVTEPWIEVDSQAPDEALAYFTITNRSGAPDRLLGATTEVADKIVVDANGAEPGLGDGSLVIPPGQTVLLKRDGVHFLLQGLHGDIHGQPFVPGTLTFERAGPLPVNFATSSSEATPPEQPDTAGDATSLVK